MTIVHLAASAEEQQLLIERYLSDPKPCCGAARFNQSRKKPPGKQWRVVIGSDCRAAPEL